MPVSISLPVPSHILKTLNFEIWQILFQKKSNVIFASILALPSTTPNKSSPHFISVLLGTFKSLLGTPSDILQAQYSQPNHNVLFDRNNSHRVTTGK